MAHEVHKFILKGTISFCLQFRDDLLITLLDIYLAPSIRFLVRGRRRKAKLYARGRRRA